MFVRFGTWCLDLLGLLLLVCGDLGLATHLLGDQHRVGIEFKFSPQGVEKSVQTPLLRFPFADDVEAREAHGGASRAILISKVSVDVDIVLGVDRHPEQPDACLFFGALGQGTIVVRTDDLGKGGARIAIVLLEKLIHATSEAVGDVDIAADSHELHHVDDPCHGVGRSFTAKVKKGVVDETTVKNLFHVAGVGRSLMNVEVVTLFEAQFCHAFAKDRDNVLFFFDGNDEGVGVDGAPVECILDTKLLARRKKNADFGS